MPRHIHDADDRVYACPSCDGAGEVYRRTHATRDYDKPFKCHKCGHEFEEPIDREAKPSPVGDADGGAPEDEDGLPHNLDPKAKRLIKQARGS
jgi:predicted RNA-binding Zn-ribbon protein involved in translation (DUF1610 family)